MADAKAIAKQLRADAEELEEKAKQMKKDAAQLKSAAHVLDPRGAKPGTKRRKRKPPKIETEPKATISSDQVLAILRNGSATMTSILRDLEREGDAVAYDEVRVILAQLVVRNEVEKNDGFYSLAAGEVTA